MDAHEFLEAIPEERQRADAIALAEVMANVSGEPAVMWGSSIVGFGTMHYRYETGREGDTATIGFSPRKGKLTIYGMAQFPEYEDLLERLGPHSTGKGCLYLRRLSDADPAVLEDILRRSWEARKQ